MQQYMDAIVKPVAGPGLELRKVPVPVPGPGEVLIKVHKTAICGTDVHIYNWDPWATEHINPPMTIGHEYVGEIAQLGEGVTSLYVGQRVSGEGHITCGHCRNCHTGNIQWCKNTEGVGVDRNGAFAEYLVIPATNVITIDESLNEEVVAFFDAFGNATHTALSWDLVGEDVLITGAGLIGSMAAAVCKKAGARTVTITDVSDYKLNLARIMGADRTVNVISGDSIAAAREDLEISEGYGVCLEMSGAPACLKDIITHSAYGANISLLGIQPGGSGIDWNTFVWKGLKMKGIYGREMWETWYKMEQMLISGLDLTPVITHKFPIADFQKGFDIMESGQCGKVILEWD